MKNLVFLLLTSVCIVSVTRGQQQCTHGFNDSNFTRGLNPLVGSTIFAKISVHDTMILKNFGIMGAGSMDSLKMGLWLFKPQERLGSLVSGSQKGILANGPVRLSPHSSKVILPFDYYLGYTTLGLNSTGFDTYGSQNRDTLFFGFYGFNGPLPQKDYPIEDQSLYHSEIWIEGECCPRADTLTVSSCMSYTSTTGHTYTQSGYYIDTVMPSAFQYCDSMVVLDVRLSGINTQVSKAGYSLTTSDSGGTYQWIDCSTNAAIAGATNPTYTDSRGGEFAVVISKNGCTDTSACHSISGIGLSELSGKAAAIYPNPTQGKFFIKYPYPETLSLRVFSLAGEEVKHDLVQAETGLQVELPHAVPGIYILQITARDFKATHKLVKY